MRKIGFEFIPPHLNCNNCGECCGIVPVGKEEISRIKEYCEQNNIKPIDTKGHPVECPFRDTVLKRCIIYPVRPLLCKFMGVVSGMECENGNSNNIDGRKILDQDMDKDIFGIIKLAEELSNIK